MRLLGRSLVQEGNGGQAVLKGFDRLNRVSLKNGLSFRATNEHRVLSPNGWVRVGDRQSGSGSSDWMASFRSRRSRMTRKELLRPFPSPDSTTTSRRVSFTTTAAKRSVGIRRKSFGFAGKTRCAHPGVRRRCQTASSWCGIAYLRSSRGRLCVTSSCGFRLTCRTKVYRSHGDEHVRFPPSELRPHGAVIRIKSYGMSQDHFQFEAVDIVRFDEEPPWSTFGRNANSASCPRPACCGSR